MSSSFLDQMAIVRDRIASRGQKVNIGTAPEPAKKVERFSKTKPAKVEKPSLGKLQSQWFDLISAEMQLSGCDRVKATSIVAKKHPALRQQMIEAANQEKGRGSRRA